MLFILFLDWEFYESYNFASCETHSYFHYDILYVFLKVTMFHTYVFHINFFTKENGIVLSHVTYSNFIYNNLKVTLIHTILGAINVDSKIFDFIMIFRHVPHSYCSYE